MAPKGNMVEKDLTGRNPYQMPVEEVAQYFKVNVEKGYTQQQAEEAQRTHPPNELVGGEAITWYRLLAKQIANAMTLILIMAMSLSFGVGDYTEGAVIAAVIVLNATIGFYQEFQAEKKMDALKELSSPSARLRRDGSDVIRPSAEVVPGDIVELKTGDTVPADLRLFKVMNLNCDESSLTGEAMPVEKVTMALTEERGVGDRTNIAHATTTVSKGHGWGIVVFTGMDTQVGIIASGTTKKERKEGRSLNAKKYGKKQVPKGAALRVWDYVGAFLGLTEGTPLQKALARLAYILFGGAILLAIVVFAVNGFKVSKEVAIYAISTGIAIIPESLVAVLTLTMVAGMKVMQKGNVVIRDLSALEALGGITNICSDKTGTLTQGAMIVKKAWLPNVGIFTVDSKDPNDPSEGAVNKSSEALPQDPSPASALKFDIPDQKDAKDQEKFNRSNENLDEPAEMTPELDAFLKPTALCNLATVKFHAENEGGPGEWKTTGEPTEKALQVFAHRFPGYGKDDLEARGWTQCHGGEFPFDSSIKRMSVAYEHKNNPNSMIFTKGAVEPIIESCSFIGSGIHTEELTENMKRNVILEHMEYFAKQGFRVLAIAQKMWDGDFAETRRRVMEAFTEEYKELLSDNDSLTAEEKANRAKTVKEAKDRIEADLRNQVESGLTFLGLVGIYDPPRVETKASIKMCREAGIDVHMLTGDHPATATAIALDIGILPRDYSEGMVKKASDFDALNDDEIDALNELPLVIARCAPHTKTKMIQALRRRKRFMAMTGDGVNDAPSLSAADVGIAMGTGSDVAKSAAKIVLSDDKFNSIVTAISQGRRMFDNIQKFTLHLLTSNVAEVILLIAGLGFQDKAGLSVFPLSPLQILWINMLTSSAPAFGLGREKPSSTIMKRLPHDTKKGIFTNEIIVDMMVYGILMGTCTLMTFVIIIYGIHDGKESLGHDCNNVFSETCIPVFRARGAVFVELAWLILVSAWEFKSIRSSMFHLDSNQDASFINFCENLFENKVLFFSVLLGGLSVFIPIYIQGLNTKVFKMKAIGVEWALCGGSILVFIGGVELWKLAKRRFHWFERNLAMGQGGEEEFFVKGLQRRSTGISSFSSQEKNAQVLALSTAPTTQSTEPKVQGLGTKMKA